MVERKSQHLLEVVLTIILQMYIPKSFQGEAILTAGFLINRMPSSPLGSEIPFKRIFPNSSLF